MTGPAHPARYVERYGEGLIDKATRDAKLAEIAGELERLDAQARIAAVPAIDWSWPPAQLNAVLRAMWDHVELDEGMRPVRAEWLVPEWRA